VGDNNLYRPISISAPSNAAHFFTAQYVNQDHARNGGNAFFAVSRCEYWTLDRNTGPASNVSVTLSWNAAACPPNYINQPADLRIVRWSGADWISEGNGGTTGTTANGTIVSSAPVSTFIAGNQFTFASSSAANPLPIVLAWFKADLSQTGTVNLLWRTSSELNNDYFEVQHGVSFETFEPLAQIKGQGTTSKATTYAAEHETPAKGINYYRLKQVDFDGNFTYSPVIALTTASEMRTLRADVFPNPATPENVQVRIVTADKTNVIRLRLIDMIGKTVYSRDLSDAGSSALRLALPGEIPAGTYLLIVQQGVSNSVVRVAITR
jgi:hypothetical protein